MKTKDIQQYFIQELENKNFTIDRTGSKTIEMIGASFIADAPSIFGKPNSDYIEAEIEWYERGSTNINDIFEDRDPPQAWQYAANEYGEINSNYGNIIFGKKYFEQYKKVLSELTMNRDTRRATMVYNRPSIWYEYCENGKDDFICTNAVTYYIRGNQLHCVVQMRSNDVVFGYKNDYAWQRYVLGMLVEDLYYSGVPLEMGNIYWQVQNLHVYERHFELVL